MTVLMEQKSITIWGVWRKVAYRMKNDFKGFLYTSVRFYASKLSNSNIGPYTACWRYNNATLNLAYTTKQGSRHSCLAQAGFIAFGKEVQLLR